MILKKSKLVKLSSFIHFKLIFKINDLKIKFPSYDYLITDTLPNLDDRNSLVYITSLKNDNFENEITLSNFIKTL